MLTAFLALDLFLLSGTALHAYVDPSAFGSIGQIIFVVFNLVILVVATCFRSIKSFIGRIWRTIVK